MPGEKGGIDASIPCGEDLVGASIPGEEFPFDASRPCEEDSIDGSIAEEKGLLEDGLTVKSKGSSHCISTATMSPKI